MKKAFITGINGQVGSYLAEYLLSKNYEIHGIIESSQYNDKKYLINLENILNTINLYSCDLNNQLIINDLIKKIQPDEFYHLAALSFVSYSFEEETTILNTNFNATHYILSCIKEIVPNCRFYFAGSSEMFGEPDESPQSELTKFNPRSVYGISKLASFHLVKYYRDYHNLFACTGITYNHESPRRSPNFVTRKITSGAAKIKLGLLDKLELGNLDITRDWGYAPDYVEAMHSMLNNPIGPNDYVISTNIPHTIKELLQIAFLTVDLDYNDYVCTNDKFIRPAEKMPLLGNSSKIYQDLAWKANKPFEEMIREMVITDLNLLQNLKVNSVRN